MGKKRIDCPACGRVALYESPADAPCFPFCSERCRLVDLDKWFREEYRIPDDIAEEGTTGRSRDLKAPHSRPRGEKP